MPVRSESVQKWVSDWVCDWISESMSQESVSLYVSESLCQCVLARYLRLHHVRVTLLLIYNLTTYKVTSRRDFLMLPMTVHIRGCRPLGKHTITLSWYCVNQSLSTILMPSSRLLSDKYQFYKVIGLTRMGLELPTFCMRIPCSTDSAPSSVYHDIWR